MSRLTKRLGDQVIIKDIGVTDCKKVCDSMDEYDNPCDMCIIDEVFRKLAHYEDIEEQGRLAEIIRCKNCIRHGDECGVGADGISWCDEHEHLTDDDDYCSYAVDKLAGCEVTE